MKRDALAGCGLDVGPLQFVEVWSPSQYRKGDFAYLNHFDTKGGIIVIDGQYKRRDTNGPDKRLPPSEVTWQSWVMAAEVDHADPGHLIAVAVFKVVNESSKRVIWHAARLSSRTKEDVDNYVEFTDKDDGYFATLGSVNGGTIVRMLADHQEEIGHRKVERVALLGNRGLTLEEPESRTFVVLLSPPRTP